MHRGQDLVGGRPRGRRFVRRRGWRLRVVDFALPHRAVADRGRALAWCSSSRGRGRSRVHGRRRVRRRTSRSLRRRWSRATWMRGPSAETLSTEQASAGSSSAQCSEVIGPERERLLRRRCTRRGRALVAERRPRAFRGARAPCAARRVRALRGGVTGALPAHDSRSSSGRRDHSPPSFIMAGDSCATWTGGISSRRSHGRAALGMGSVGRLGCDAETAGFVQLDRGARADRGGAGARRGAAHRRGRRRGGWRHAAPRKGHSPHLGASANRARAPSSARAGVCVVDPRRRRGLLPPVHPQCLRRDRCRWGFAANARQQEAIRPACGAPERAREREALTLDPRPTYPIRVMDFALHRAALAPAPDGRARFSHAAEVCPSRAEVGVARSASPRDRTEARRARPARYPYSCGVRRRGDGHHSRTRSASRARQGRRLVGADGGLAQRPRHRTHPGVRH